MYGFTITLRRKNSYSRSVRKARDSQKKQSDIRRYRSGNKKVRKLPIRISRIMPMAFLICAICVGAFLPKNENVKSTQEKISVSNKTVDYFNLPDDDYSFYYVPLIINGIYSYEENDELNDEMIAACCWSLLSDKTAPEKYENNDAKTVIPAKDVKKRFEELFGSKKEFENKSVNINGCNFEYLNGEYTIEITGMTPTFLPKLLKLESEYGKVTLSVGCLKNDEYVQDKNGNIIEPEPSKKLNVILADDGENMYVKSVSLAES